MAIPIALEGLNTREAITDVLYRCIAAWDHNDRELLKSSMLEDATFSISGQGSITGIDTIIEGSLNRVGPLDTLHQITNIRIDVKEGASTASLLANAVAHHYRTGEGVDSASQGLVSGGFYNVDLVKDSNDGSWKIKQFELKLVWTQGDRSVMGV